MVKVGTVIDPDMRDELHVTVVATGLGARIEKPVKVVDNTLQSAAAAYGRPTLHRCVRSSLPSITATGASDRDAQPGPRRYAAAAKLNPQDDLDYLDIPAFLRRQAD